MDHVKGMHLCPETFPCLHGKSDEQSQFETLTFMREVADMLEEDV